MHQLGIREKGTLFVAAKIIIKMESDEKAMLQRLLSENDTSVVLTDISGRSEVTKKFLRVEKDGVKMPYASCKTCRHIIKYHSDSGTSGLQRHSCKAARSSRQPAISSFMKRKVPATVKSRFTDVMTRMCSQDLRPFAIVEGRGFIEFAKELINIGAKYGSSIEIEDVLPSARTVSRHVEDEYERVKKHVMEELQQVGLATLLFCFV